MKQCIFILGTIFSVLTQAACSSNPPLVTPAATLASGMGVVTGVLQLGTKETTQQINNVVLYLAATVKDSTGKDIFVGLDRVNSPRTVSDNSGRFVFPNVPPGTYGLVIDTVIASYLLMDPNSDEALLVEVSAGRQIDLGTLIYDSLPILYPHSPGTYPYP